MIFDTHMHTEFSTDSTMKLKDAIKASKEKNFGIIITEHLDPTYPKENEFRCDINSYLEAYSKYKSDSLLLGIEIGLSDIESKFDDSIGNLYDLDYIIGSIHSIYDCDIYLEYSKILDTKENYFLKYLNYIQKCLNLHDNFDSLGHIDYICRYCPFEEKILDVALFKEKLIDIFNILISKNKVLELNTVRLSTEEGRNNLYDILSLYKTCGGKYITLGSDAHNSTDIFRNFDFALELCRNLNLYPVYFKNRKMHLCNI